MQGYDLIMLAILAGTTIFGAYKGMAWQLAAIASLGRATLLRIFQRLFSRYWLVWHNSTMESILPRCWCCIYCLAC